MRPQAVLFDCDGVLADSEMLVNAIVAEQLTALGWPMSAAEARQTFLGLALPDMVPRIVAEHIVNGRPVQEYTIGAAEGE